MTAQNWYSAKLRFVILIENTGSEHFSDSVFLLRSIAFGAAFSRALEIGRREEHEYLNGEGERVSWRFVKVLTLNIIQTDELDGAEVHHEFCGLGKDEHYEFSHEFDPETSEPGQTF
jgi:hypothetical protein